MSHCCFATDDRHADLLAGSGGVDDCIRRALSEGVELEIALCAATLSPAERFRLQDRGAIVPGRLADFCVLDRNGFSVQRTFKLGLMMEDQPFPAPICPAQPFRCRLPGAGDLAVQGEGEARVIGLVRGEIGTRERRMPVQGNSLPDTTRDILKVVVVDRYRASGWGIGLVQGFGLQEGAISSSVSHDAHNLIAVGADDTAIAAALAEVAGMQGGMVAVSGSRITRLPLPCAGLMSPAAHEEVVQSLADLATHVCEMGGIRDAFMSASFLALPVVPELRITARGIFDVPSFRFVRLFSRG
jgi:adenine deaminase